MWRFGGSSFAPASGSQNANTQATATPRPADNNSEDDISPDTSPIEDEVALDTDEQWSAENDESNRELDTVTPPNNDSALAIDSDANWSPDGLPLEESPPNTSPIDDDREIPIDSDLNWQAAK
ncbi:MAG: hypothetical protein COA42_12490 [Alteromonadaceae bacterium]|nr:MAG: hypothetical protein COA42_12490 [Alteromonadaceae bacterium]